MCIFLAVKGIVWRQLSTILGNVCVALDDTEKTLTMMQAFYNIGNIIEHAVFIDCPGILFLENSLNR